MNFVQLCESNEYDKVKELIPNIDQKTIQQGYDIVVRNNNIKLQCLLLQHGAKMKFNQRLKEPVWNSNDYFFGPTVTF